MLNIYPAKVLLFGEYTVLSGSMALAVPLNDFCGRWNQESLNSINALASRENINKFIHFNQLNKLNIEKLQSDLKNGLWFDSSIPQGLGLGSSGALIAALYERYFEQDLTLDILGIKTQLASLENFFHGHSSGVDPLVSLLKRTIIIHSLQNIEVLNFNLNLNDFYLLNSQTSRQTGSLVKIFQEKMTSKVFSGKFLTILVEEVNNCIKSLVGNSDKLSHHLWHLSKFQWDHFQEMIPDNIKTYWKDGLDRGDYLFKLCGAGGGGHMLLWQQHPHAFIQQSLELIHLGSAISERELTLRF